MVTLMENEQQAEQQLALSLKVMRKVLTDYIETGNIDQPSALALKHATAFTGVYARLRQSKSAEEQTAAVMGTRLGFSGDDLREFTRLNMPRIALPEPRKESPSEA